jgi:glycosyltransferase involved in cell wall biosynthesis
VDKKKKSVAVMCFSSGCGGMELDAIKLASRLHQIADVTLLCKADSFIQEQYDSGFKQGRFGFTCLPVAFTSRTFSPAMLFSVRSFLRKNSADNVIFFGASELKTLYFAFLGSNINLIVRHGTTKSRAKTDWFHRLVYSGVDYHVALSKHLIENVKKIVPSHGSEQYKVIYSSFDFDPDSSPKVHGSAGPLKIVHVGRVVEGKGQIDAVKACKALKDKPVEFSFEILGGLEDSQYVGRLKDIISAEDMVDDVHLFGHVSDVSEHLQGADVFLFPSSGEGMPNSFIEAMFCNNVCITYDNTVFPELRDMGFYFHLIKDGDVKALSSKLLQVALSIDDERRKASENPSLAKKYFQPDRELAEWDEVLV